MHAVVFIGFSVEALRSRIDDADAKVEITADPKALATPADPAVMQEILTVMQR